jgi:hypothetical protein
MNKANYRRTTASLETTTIQIIIVCSTIGKLHGWIRHGHYWRLCHHCSVSGVPRFSDARQSVWWCKTISWALYAFSVGREPGFDITQDEESDDSWLSTVRSRIPRPYSCVPTKQENRTIWSRLIDSDPVLRRTILKYENAYHDQDTLVIMINDVARCIHGYFQEVAADFESHTVNHMRNTLLSFIDTAETVASGLQVHEPPRLRG